MGEIVTWGAKVPDEFKAEFVKLIDKSGMQAGEFLQHIAAIYEMEMSKKFVPTIASDLDEVKKLTNRLLNAYIGMAQRINTFGEEKQQEVDRIVEEKNTEVLRIQAKLATAAVEEESLKNMISDTVVERDEALEKIGQLQENVKANEETIFSQKELISSYKEKIDSLSGIITEYETYKTEYNKLVKTLQDSDKEVEQVKGKFKELQSDLKFIENEKVRLDKEYVKEMARTKEQADFEKKQAILDANIAHQRNIEELNTKYQRNIEEMVEKHQQQIEELHRNNAEHIKSLYEQINKLQAIKEE